MAENNDQSNNDDKPLIGENSRTSDTTELNKPPADSGDDPPAGDDKKTDPPPADDKKTDPPPADDKKTDPPADDKKDDKKKSLTGLDDKDLPPEDKKEDKKAVIDPSMLNDDGTINEEKVLEYMKGVNENEEKLHKRVNDMRRMVSQKGDVPKEKDEFFGSFVPEEEFLPLFEDDAPEGTKEALKDWTGKLADKYFEIGLNKKQADEISQTFLNLAKDMGVIDTRTPDQIEKDNNAWLDEQKKNLGENARGIITETTNFILNNPRFSEKSKNKLINLMDTVGSDMISVLYELKENHGSGSAGHIPTKVNDLGGLPPDKDLLVEYRDPKTTPERKEQIIKQRHVAGRTGKLWDVADM